MVDGALLTWKRFRSVVAQREVVHLGRCVVDLHIAGTLALGLRPAQAGAGLIGRGIRGGSGCGAPRRRSDDDCHKWCETLMITSMLLRSFLIVDTHQ